MVQSAGQEESVINLIHTVLFTLQHGFSEDNFRELLFAVNQLLREEEVANERYARIVRQILKEFMQDVNANSREVESEVSCKRRKWQVDVIIFFSGQIFGVLLEIVNGIQTWPRHALEDHSSRYSYTCPQMEC